MSSLSSLIISAIILIIVNSGKSYRILGVFPLNEKSHFFMCEQLMKILAKRGHQVDVISHFPLKEPYPNYKDLSLKGSIPDIVNNITYNAVRALNTNALETLMTVAGDPICGLLKHPSINNIIKNPPKDPLYDLIIVELFAAQCYFAFGRHLKVPMIAVETSPGYNYETEPIGKLQTLAFTPADFTGFPSKMNFWQRLQNVFLDRMSKIQFNKLVTQQQKYVDEIFGPGYPSIYELSTELDLVFVNSHYSLNGNQPLHAGFVEVGGLHIEDTKEKLIPELQKWLNESNHGCVYVSLGSMVKIESFPKETLEAFYATFRNIAPVRVLMKIAKPEELLPGLPKNVKTHSWLPQIRVLKHKNVKAFITHGGLMGSLEAILYGVPMVAIPLFGDQPNNAKLYEEKKIAVLLDIKNITEEGLTKAVNNVLNNNEYRRNIQKLAKIYYDRPISPQEAVIFWTEYVIKHSSVLRSPAVSLTWWQVELIDIYGFILFIVLFLIYITFLIIRFSLKFIFYTTKENDEGPLSKKIK